MFLLISRCLLNTYRSWIVCIFTEVKDLIHCCLTFDPLQRLSLDELLSHPWMQAPSMDCSLAGTAGQWLHVCQTTLYWLPPVNSLFLCTLKLEWVCKQMGDLFHSQGPLHDAGNLAGSFGDKSIYFSLCFVFVCFNKTVAVSRETVAIARVEL